MKPEAVLFAVFTLALAACASGAVDAPATDPAPMAARASGYLTPETTPDAALIIPPAPADGDARDAADAAVFRLTRALEGSERWALAQADDSYRPDYLLQAFSCAVGAELTPANAPALAELMTRVGVDAGAAAVNAKAIYKRQRPFLREAGAICIERSDALARSYDYPSGHASAGWVEGLMLASLAPDRAGPILRRARAYGESRIVCGVHNWSAVEAGRTNGAAVFAALQGSADFQAAMTRARTEVATARGSGARPDAAACAREAALTAPLLSR
jgi:acid phosphatase (class A)